MKIENPYSNELNQLQYKQGDISRQLKDIKREATDSITAQFAKAILEEKETLTERELHIILWDMTHKIRDIDSY